MARPVRRSTRSAPCYPGRSLVWPFHTFMSIFGKPKKQASSEVSAIVSVANKHQA